NRVQPRTPAHRAIPTAIAPRTSPPNAALPNPAPCATLPAGSYTKLTVDRKRSTCGVLPGLAFLGGFALGLPAPPFTETMAKTNILAQRLCDSGLAGPATQTR